MKKVIFGQLGKLKRDKIEEYCTLHAATWPGVLNTISACNLKNYSIFLQDDMVFSYFEYTGENYDADMAKMAQDTVTQDWWHHTHPCFETFAIDPQSEYYHDMRQIIYHP